MVHFKKTYLCERRLRLVSVFKRKKNEKNEKNEIIMNVASNVAIDSGHVRVGFVIERATFVDCPRPCCWPRFWPRSSQCGYLLATLRPRSTWPEHGPQHGRALWPHYNVAREFTFPVMFRPRSWPRSGHVRGHPRPRSWPRSNLIFEVF